MLKPVADVEPFTVKLCGLCSTPWVDLGSSGSASWFSTLNDLLLTTTPANGRNSQNSATTSVPLYPSTKALSSTSITATTAFFRPPSLPTSMVGMNRLSPSISALLGFFGQNFGFGNLAKENSFFSGFPL